MEFDFWSSKMISIYESIKHQINFDNIHKAKTIIIRGNIQSGKSSLLEKCLDTIWMNSDFEKKIDSIIKITLEENVIKVYEIKKNNKKGGSRILGEINFTPKLSVFGLEISYDLMSLISNYISNKKIHIVIFEDVTLNGTLSVQKINEFLKTFDNGRILTIITTKDTEVSEYLIDTQSDAYSFELPLITFDDYLEQAEKISENQKTSYISILSRLKKINDEKEIKKIIELSQGSYGILLFILDYIASGEKIEKKNIDDIFKTLEISDSNLEKILIPLFYLPKGVSVDWLELIFSNSNYDYMKYLKDAATKKLIIEDNLTYGLTSNFFLSREDYIETCSDFRGKLMVAKVIGKQLKLEQPENYLLRSEVVGIYDSQLSKELIFLHSIQSNQIILENTTKLSTKQLEILELILDKKKGNDLELIEKFEKLNSYLYIR